MNYNGTIYSYVHNMRRDFVGLRGLNGMLVVDISMIQGGRITATAGPLADTLEKTSPFRYRCNPYDKETGLYYIQKRYYSPNYLRFLGEMTQKLRCQWARFPHIRSSIVSIIP